MMYPQAFNNQNPIVPPMANNLQKTTMNNYLPQNHMNMINQQPNNLGTNSLNKQHNILSYGNTKPLTHFNADLSQRMTPPMANPNKSPLMPYIQQQPPQPQQQQQQLQAPRAHLSEDQKRMLLMKQKGVMSQPLAYAALPSHGQVGGEVMPPAPCSWCVSDCDALARAGCHLPVEMLPTHPQGVVRFGFGDFSFLFSKRWKRLARLTCL